MNETAPVLRRVRVVADCTVVGIPPGWLNVGDTVQVERDGRGVRLTPVRVAVEAVT